MFETRSSFGLPAKPFQVRFGGSRAHANHLECHCAIETVLMRPVNHALTAATDDFQQFVITQLSQCLYSGAGFLLWREAAAAFASTFSAEPPSSTAVRQIVFGWTEVEFPFRV